MATRQCNKYTNLGNGDCHAIVVLGKQTENLLQDRVGFVNAGNGVFKVLGEIVEMRDFAIEFADTKAQAKLGEKTRCGRAED